MPQGGYDQQRDSDQNIDVLRDSPAFQRSVLGCRLMAVSGGLRQAYPAPQTNYDFDQLIAAIEMT